MTRPFLVWLVVIPAVLTPGPGGHLHAQEGGGGPDAHVYLTRDEALREIFPNLSRVMADRWTLSREQVHRIARAARVSVADSSATTFRVLGRSGGLLGYAAMLDEVGKYRPITFVAATDSAFAVRRVEVMVYREDRGGEVRYRRFLRQYEGKTGRDPIRTNLDIVNITGASISVNSLNRGVRRAIALLENVYQATAPEPIASNPIELSTP